MPAAVTTLRLDDNLVTPSFREWVATATVGSGDYAAGATVTVTVAMTSGGPAPPGVDETFQLIVKNSAGTTVRTINLTANTASQSTSFVLTANGSAGGGDRCGVFEMVLRADRDSVVAYDVSSDNSTNSPPAGFVTEHSRGWVRGTTSNTMSLSNVSAGGAKTQPASFNESIFVRSVLGHQSIGNYTLTLGVTDSLGGPAQTGTSSSTNSATRDVTLSGIVDDRFTAASRTFTSSVSIPNDTLTGAAWTVLTTTQDTITADPRITITHHLQVNNNTYSAGLNQDSRLTSDLGFATWKATNARGEPISGLVATHSLGDTDNLVADTYSVSETTGASGLPPSMQTWDAALPGGSWTHVVSVTTADATGLASPENEAWTLLAINPDLEPLVYLGFNAAGNDDRHIKAGDNLRVAFTVKNRGTRKRVAPDAGSVSVSLLRYVTGTGWQYLSSGNVWTAWGSGVVADEFAMTDDGDGLGFTKDYTSTSGWGTSDIVAVNVVCKIGGTPYGWYTQRELVGGANGHDGYVADPAPFLGLPGKK